MAGQAEGIIDNVQARADTQISKAEASANTFISTANSYLGQARNISGKIDTDALDDVRALVSRLADNIPDIPTFAVPTAPSTDIPSSISLPSLDYVDADRVDNQVNALAGKLQTLADNISDDAGYGTPSKEVVTANTDFSIDDSGLFSAQQPAQLSLSPQTAPAPLSGLSPITSTISSLHTPAFSGSVPTLSSSNPGRPNDIVYPVMPVVPELTLPNDPDLITDSGIVVPDVPTIEIPDFVYSVITQMPEPFVLDDQPSFWEVAANAKTFLDGLVTSFIDEQAPGARDAITLAQSKLTAILNNQQMAIRDDVEGRIFERARLRAEAERSRVDNEILTNAAKRGFTLPSAQIASALIQSQQATADNISNAALETAVQRAQLEREYWQFAVQATQNAWSTALQAASQHVSNVSQLAIAAGQYSALIARLGMEAFNASVELFKADLQRITTEAAIYETRVKAELYKIEGFKAEIEAEKLKVEIDKARIDLYQSRIDAAVKSLEPTLARLKVAEVQTQLELAKLQGFKAEVEAYSAEVDAYTAEVGGYRAGVEAEKTKVDAEMVRVQAEKARIEAEIAAQQSTIAAKQAEVDVYKALIAGDSLQVDIYGKQIEAFKTLIEADAERLKARIAEQQGKIAKVESDTKIRMVDVEVYKAKMDGFRASLEAKRSASEAYAAALKGQEAAYNVIKSQNELLIQRETLRVTAEKATVDADIAKVKGEVDIFSTSMQAATALANTAAQATPALANAAANDIEAQIKKITAGLNEIVGILGVLQNAYGGVTSGSYQTAASAISGMNGIAMHLTSEALS